MEEKTLNLTDLRIDGDTQPRVAIDQAVVLEYAEAIGGGATFPPVKVVHDGATYWLVDGFHRYFAHKRLNRQQIVAEVVTGELADARWLSLASNKTHGLRRSNPDKAKAVRRAMDLRPGASDHMIADHVGVSQPMVSRHRAARSATEKVFQSPTRAGRDGRRINTSNIRHSNQRRREAPTISRHAFQPVRTGSRPLPMTALNMPHDPVMGAKTLIELFGADYLRALVEFLSKHLQGEKR